MLYSSGCIGVRKPYLSPNRTEEASQPLFRHGPRKDRGATRLTSLGYLHRAPSIACPRRSPAMAGASRPDALLSCPHAWHFAASCETAAGVFSLCRLSVSLSAPVGRR